MSLYGAYQDDNVFAKILRGEIPKVTVYEDDAVLAFMDVFPDSRGHLLVVSKTSKARNLLDVEPDVLCGLMTQAQRLARAITAALRPDGVRMVQLNGAAAGQTIFHLHVHLIPVWAGQPLGGQKGPAEVETLKAVAAQITAELD